MNVVVHTGGRHIDLEVYRFGVQAWLAGGDMYGTLPETSDHITLPFIYPPFAAIVLLPLAVAPWVLAWSALLALSTAALGLTFYVVARRLWPSGGRGGALSVASIALPLALAVQPGKAIDFSQPAPPIPAFALEPVMQTIEFGQVNLLLMALVAADVLVARPRWPRGLLIGIAAAIKLTPAAFVLYFLLRREYRAAAVAAVSGALVTGLAFLRRAGPVLEVLAGQPRRRGERLAVLHEPDLPGGAGQGGCRRVAEDGAVAGAVGRGAGVGRPGDPACAATARADGDGGGGAAGLADVLVAPLGVGGAVPARRGRVGVARPFVHLARGHGLVGGGVRRGAAPARPARTTARAGRSTNRIFGGTYVWFTVLLFVVLWWRWRAAR